MLGLDLLDSACFRPRSSLLRGFFHIRAGAVRQALPHGLIAIRQALRTAGRGVKELLTEEPGPLLAALAEFS